MFRPIGFHCLYLKWYTGYFNHCALYFKPELGGVSSLLAVGWNGCVADEHPKPTTTAVCG